MDFGQIVALLATLGLGGILTQGAKTALERLTGRADREQNAWQQRDQEANHRRRLEETLQQTRHCWNAEAGKPYDQMPPWPRRPDHK